MNTFTNPIVIHYASQGGKVTEIYVLEFPVTESMANYPLPQDFFRIMYRGYVQVQKN